MIMNLYITKSDALSKKSVVLDDMILTKSMPTTAGSKMLEGYKSLFDAEIISRLAEAGFEISGKANVGEMGLDLMGETSYYGACVLDNGNITNASAEIVKTGEVCAAINLDVNGAPRRAAAINELTYIKPTYGTVSRYGTIPSACSGETVGIMAQNVSDCRKILSAISGHDEKDGTSLPQEKCDLLKFDAECESIKKIAVVTSMLDNVSDKTKTLIDNFKIEAAANGVEIIEIDVDILKAAQVAWNILMSAEVCNNVSRYDGVKYGYRSSNYTNIDELYTNSRTESFGYLLKSTILFGSDTLSTDNYMKVYDKALRIRRVISEKMTEILESVDAVLLPACSKTEYSENEVKGNTYIAYDESIYTAIASITGLPAMVTSGVQLIGKAFSENSLLDLAQKITKEEK